MYNYPFRPTTFSIPSIQTNHVVMDSTHLDQPGSTHLDKPRSHGLHPFRQATFSWTTPIQTNHVFHLPTHLDKPRLSWTLPQPHSHGLHPFRQTTLVMGSTHLDKPRCHGLHPFRQTTFVMDFTHLHFTWAPPIQTNHVQEKLYRGYFIDSTYQGKQCSHGLHPFEETLSQYLSPYLVSRAETCPYPCYN